MDHRQHVEFHPHLLGQRIAEIAEPARQVFRTLEGVDFFQAALHAGPGVVLAHQIKTFTRDGDVEKALLNGAGEIKKVRVLHHKHPVQAFGLHESLQCLYAASQFSSGSDTHGCPPEKKGHSLETSVVPTPCPR